MVVQGRIENGVVVLSDAIALPNGAAVTVIVPAIAPEVGADQRRVQLPLVPSKTPGARQLSADDVAKLLSQDELSP